MKLNVFIMSVVLLSVLVVGAFAEEPVVLTGPYLGEEPPGDKPRLFSPGVVSTGKEHSAAMFTADGTELWFGRMFPAAIWYMKQVDGQWTEPKLAPFAHQAGELYPFLVPSGDRIFYNTMRPLTEGGAPLRNDQGHLWCVERTGSQWKKPEYQNARINSLAGLACGSVAESGTMYLSARTTSDGKPNHDLFTSELVDGSYSEPVNLGQVINSPAPEFCPFVAPDESYLIFSSFQGGSGLSDLFISYRNHDGSWTKPRNLGTAINSSAKDDSPYVTADGEYLFFNSNRRSALNSSPIPDGPGNMYWVNTSFIERLKPEDMK
ncbi:MAG: hypothetical protein OEV49_04195 [candidate division Zixibacteria bacterium]|nr:hypothetical protein [candidate division Zixibacteria bacterium]MDH3936217.1 hypothetical protein [candidate division Zixibacteria bacterium]MDH4032996.1 hypothetical protein [candidate division Zixibacteria bacterium]